MTGFVASSLYNVQPGNKTDLLLHPCGSTRDTVDSIILYCMTIAHGGATGTALDLRSIACGFQILLRAMLLNNLGQVVHT